MQILEMARLVSTSQPVTMYKHTHTEKSSLSQVLSNLIKEMKTRKGEGSYRENMS